MDWNGIINYRQFCGCLSDLSFGVRIISDWVNLVVVDWDNET